MKRIIPFFLLGSVVFLLVLSLQIGTGVLKTEEQGIQEEQFQNREAQVFQAIPVRLVVEGVAYELQVVSGSSVYDVMKQARATKGLEFQGRDFSGIGYFVEEINRKREDFKGRHFWILYMNGQKAKAGVSSLFVNNQDIIEWKYENEI